MFLSLLLCSIFTFHMPNCVIVVLLYVLYWMLLFLIATNWSFVALENNFLYTHKGIMFPSLPVSTLYGTIIGTWFDNVFRLPITTKCSLLKFKEFMQFEQGF